MDLEQRRDNSGLLVLAVGGLIVWGLSRTQAGGTGNGGIHAQEAGDVTAAQSGTFTHLSAHAGEGLGSTPYPAVPNERWKTAWSFKYKGPARALKGALIIGPENINSDADAMALGNEYYYYSGPYNIPAAGDWKEHTFEWTYTLRQRSFQELIGATTIALEANYSMVKPGRKLDVRMVIGPSGGGTGADWYRQKLDANTDSDVFVYSPSSEAELHGSGTFVHLSATKLYGPAGQKAMIARPR
jgi:hypothetical protein